MRRFLDACAALMIVAFCSACLGFGADSPTSDVSIENVAAEMPPSDGQRARIVFDIAWGNSFRDQLNWDAVWVFAKFREAGGAWRHATLDVERSTPVVVANNGVLASVEPVTDGRGVFMYRAEDGFSSIDWDQVSLAWDLAADGVENTASVEVAVLGIEMVYIPEGTFFLGDGMTVEGRIAAQFERGSSGAAFEVRGEEALLLGGGDADSLGNHGGRLSSATPQQFRDDFGSATEQTLSAQFPKGFAAFYVMKHEITQGEYARFLNLLDGSQRGTRNPAVDVPPREPHRYAISTAAPFGVAPHNRAANFLSWMDVAAFADWSGLRPMTELEFEKAGRGDRLPEVGEFAWGPEAPPANKYSLQDEGTAEELITNQNQGANVAFDGTVGLASSIAGPLRVGGFVPLARSRLEFGGSYYRVTELSGNVAEMVVSIGRATGRRFGGRHGDGELSMAGNAGGANVELWPGARRVARGGFEVLLADGSGLRGGDWAGGMQRLELSDREDINKPPDRRDMRWGGRLVRSAR